MEPYIIQLNELTYLPVKSKIGRVVHMIDSSCNDKKIQNLANILSEHFGKIILK